jgi:hypothetical protein
MKNRYIKLFLRLLGLVGGFYGIFFVGSALICLKETILNPAQGGSYVLYIIRLLVGIYLIYVAYLALFRFSKKAIRNLCFIIAFFIGIRLPGDIIMENYNVYSLGHVLFQILCIVSAVLFYIIGSKLFIKWCLNNGEN